MEVKDSVEDYTWDELSQISQAIADVDVNASDYDFSATDVAAAFNLCASDGSLDGSQTKSFTYTNFDGESSTVAARIIGFAHDDRADGSGKAGITFLLTSGLETRAMCHRGSTNEGGWEESAGRSLLNDDVLSGFPADLTAVIVPAAKMTNNQGEGDPNKIAQNKITETDDTLWLLSAVEILGGFNGDNVYTDTLEDEGEQYQYFDELGIDSDYLGDKGCDELVLGEDDWWLRSPMPTSDDMFCTVEGEQWASHDGTPGSVGCINAGSKQLLVPAFCI